MTLFSTKHKTGAEAISTLISEETVLDGNLKAPSFARIDGQINGDVHVDEGLILGENGSIFGNISTKELVVYGTVHGNLYVHSLEIKASSRITGEIKTQTLSVESGAIYNGNLSIVRDTKPAVSFQPGLME
jgi:cytoskeletal protein CcmA (bactofilin family)